MTINYKFTSIFVFLIIQLIGSGCRIDGSRKVSQNELKFSTTDDSELFFRNIRQIHYDLEEIPAEKTVTYRIKSRQQSGDHPVLNIAIEWHWLTDSAFIILEPNRLIKDMGPLDMQIQCPEPMGSSNIRNPLSGDKFKQTALAVDIYNCLLDNCAISLKAEKVDVVAELFTDTREREVFRKTVADYLRLVRVYH